MKYKLVVLDLDGGLDALSCAGVRVADAAGSVLRSGRSRVQLLLGVAAAAADDFDDDFDADGGTPDIGEKPLTYDESNKDGNV